MRDDGISLADGLNALAEELRGDHPTPEELMAYHSGELSEAVSLRVKRHLVWCSQCTETVLDLAKYPKVELRNADLHRTREAEEADWQRLQQRLQEESAASSGAPATWSRGPRRDRLLLRALAATLIFAVLGLSTWVLQLQRRVAELTAPRANVFVSDLEAVGQAMTRFPGQDVIEVPPGMDRLVLLLSFTGFDPFEAYELEIRDAAGSRLWQHRGLSRTPEGSFSVEFSSQKLPSGSYEFRLFGVRGTEVTRLAIYRTSIEYGASD